MKTLLLAGMILAATTSWAANEVKDGPADENAFKKYGQTERE